MRTIRVPSKTDSSKVYRVDLAPDGEGGWRAVCNCQGAITHPKAICIHAREAIETVTNEPQTVEQTDLVVRGSDPEPDAQAERQLVPVEATRQSRNLPTVDEIRVMNEIAKSVYHTRGSMVPEEIDNPHKALAVMMAGWELGFKPMTSFRHIFLVNGRIDLSAQGMMGVVMSREPAAKFDFVKRDHEACVVRFTRPGQTPILSEYTIEDAIRAGQYKQEWVGKTGPISETRRRRDGGTYEAAVTAPWYSYTRDMLAYAAVKRALRLGAPDLTNAIEALGEGMVGDVAAIAESLAPEQIGSPSDDAMEEVEEVRRALNNLMGETDITADDVEEFFGTLDMPSIAEKIRESGKPLDAAMRAIVDQKVLNRDAAQEQKAAQTPPAAPEPPKAPDPAPAGAPDPVWGDEPPPAGPRLI